MTTGLMMDHRRSLYGTESAIDWNRLPVIQIEHLPQVFEFSSPRVTNKCQYPFPGFPGSYCVWSSLRNHLNRQNWRYSIMILKNNPRLYPTVRAVYARPHLGSSTTVTTPYNSSGSERNAISDGRHYNTTSRQLIWLSDSTRSC